MSDVSMDLLLAYEDGYKSGYAEAERKAKCQSQNVCPYYIRNKHNRGDDSLCRKAGCEVKAVREQKSGEWKSKMLDNFRKYEVVCSECGARYVGNYDAYDEPSEFNFCPNCGAMMEES